MSKIEMSDNFGEIIIKLSEGNPGAMSFLFEIAKAKNNDPSQFLGTFLVLDTIKLYGSYLYMLWNDCCERNLEKSLKVIELYQNGKVTDLDINERIKNVGYGKSFDDLLEAK